jgi:hypothetical protein
MGRSLGAFDTSYGQQNVNFDYTAALVTQAIYIASRKSVITDITGRVRVAGSGGACTLQIFKAPSGTAIGSGTLVHSGSFNLVGTADTNQVLVLATPLDTLTLQVGDALGYVLTGTATSAVGTFVITLEPA